MMILFDDKVEKNVVFGRFLDFDPIMIFWLKKRETRKLVIFVESQSKKYVWRNIYLEMKF